MENSEEITKMTDGQSSPALHTWDIVAVVAYFIVILGVGISVSILN